MNTTLQAHTLSLEGPDAIAFAQAQFSSKVDTLAVGRWQFSAWLDPHGRVRALFHLARVGDDKLLLLLRGGHADALAGDLRRFVFRSRLTISASSTCVLASGAALPLHEVVIDGQDIALGGDTHALRVVSTGPGDDAWRPAQWRMGWPWLPDATLGTCLAPSLSLHRLQAVAVDKGCYPGQEIVARLHFRGGCKRHLHGVTLSQPVAAGETLRIDGREAGVLLDVIAGDTVRALAVLHDEITAGAEARPLVVQAGDRTVALTMIEHWGT